MPTLYISSFFPLTSFFSVFPVLNYPILFFSSASNVVPFIFSSLSFFSSNFVSLILCYPIPFLLPLTVCTLPSSSFSFSSFFPVPPVLNYPIPLTAHNILHTLPSSFPSTLSSFKFLPPSPISSFFSFLFLPAFITTLFPSCLYL